jgi:acyl transferase domain-containing protein
MHYAAREIVAQDCDQALAAGVNLTLNPKTTSMFTVTGAYPLIARIWLDLM